MLAGASGFTGVTGATGQTGVTGAQTLLPHVFSEPWSHPQNRFKLHKAMGSKGLMRHRLQALAASPA